MKLRIDELTKVQNERRAKAMSCGPDCARCPFSVNGKPTNPILGVGGVGSVGILLAEFPSKDDVEAGEVLSGQLGQQFDYILTTNSLPREKLFVVPAIACRPNIERTEKNLRAAAAACRPLLLSQLSKFPRDIHILALGKIAYYALTNSVKGVFKGRGFLRPFKLPEDK